VVTIEIEINWNRVALHVALYPACRYYIAFEAVVGLRWGPRGPGPPERPGGPRETSVLRGFKGPVKGPLKLQDDHPSFIGALLQFASVFVLKLQ